MVEGTLHIHREKTTVGVVLTSGWEISEHAVIRPNAEGRIRAQAAVENFKHHIISKVYVLGGAEVKAAGTEEANLYIPYTKSLIRESGTNHLVQSLPGSTETGSDLEKALKSLGNVSNLRIYSTSFHLGRVALILKSLGRQAVLVNAERVVEQASPEGADFVKETLTQEHLKKMYDREEKITNVLGLLDHNPFIPFANKLRLGSRLIEFMAPRR